MRLAIVTGSTGTTLYGNRAAFRTLARWMTWLAESDPRDHYEFHLPWHFQSPSRTKRVKVLQRSHGAAYRASRDFEVTMMAVENSDWQALRPRTRRSAKKSRKRTP
jgi:hypothetical protein